MAGTENWSDGPAAADDLPEVSMQEVEGTHTDPKAEHFDGIALVPAADAEHIHSEDTYCHIADEHRVVADCRTQLVEQIDHTHTAVVAADHWHVDDTADHCAQQVDNAQPAVGPRRLHNAVHEHSGKVAAADDLDMAVTDHMHQIGRTGPRRAHKDLQARVKNSAVHCSRRVRRSGQVGANAAQAGVATFAQIADLIPVGGSLDGDFLNALDSRDCRPGSVAPDTALSYSVDMAMSPAGLATMRRRVVRM